MNAIAGRAALDRPESHTRIGHAWKHPKRLPRPWGILWHGLEVIGPIGLAVLSFVVAAYPAHLKPLLIAAVALACVTILATAILKWVQFSGDARLPFFEGLLEDLWDELWKNRLHALDGARHHHRITFFELKRLPWWRRMLYRGRWTHLLVPRLRVPRGGQRPRRAWKVHEHKTEHCEGVAGQVFAKGGKVLISETLPDLHTEKVKRGREKLIPAGWVRRRIRNARSTLNRCGLPVTAGPFYNDVFRYAKLTDDTPAVVEKELYFARVIGGVAILHGGQRYGVLILDSPDAAALTMEHFQHEATRRALRIQSRLVTGSERTS